MDENDSMRESLGEMMGELQRIAFERDSAVSDVISEAVGEFLYSRKIGTKIFDVLNSIEQNMSGIRHFAVNTDLGRHIISIKSPLRYTYRPELKYEVRISLDSRRTVGQMTVRLRTHDINTLKSFAEFLNFWIELETKYIALKVGQQIAYTVDTGYFSRAISILLHDSSVHFTGQGTGEATDNYGQTTESAIGDYGQAAGSAIGDYIQVFDELFKYSYSHPGSNWNEIEKIYISYLKSGKVKI